MLKNKGLFHYNKKVDKTISRAVSEVLKVDVKKVVKMRHGEVNHVYKIVADKGNFLARVFKNKNFFKGYGQHQFSQSQIAKIEKALHIIKTTVMMEYYFYNKQSPLEFKRTLKKLKKLLD